MKYAYRYQFDIKIGQSAIAGIPMGDPMIIFSILKESFDKPTFNIIDKGEIVDSWNTTARFKDVVNWLNIILKDHKSEKAKKAFQDFKSLFGNSFYKMMMDSEYYDKEIK